MILNYLRSRIRIIIIFAVIAGIFASSYLLFDMPAVTVLYPLILSIVILLIIGTADLLITNNKHKKLAQNEIPPTNDLIEKDYQEIIAKLKEEEELSRRKASSDYNNMVEYYTVWAHQIKTPIASMRLQIQSMDSETARRLDGDLSRIYYVYEAFKLWSEAGADMIIGHHPHVPQGMTCFGKTPAYFSLGNFVFYQPVKFFHRKTGYFLEIEADKNGITAHRAIPYRIEETNLRLLTPDEQAEFEQLFAKLSAPLADSRTAKEAWNAVLAYNGLQGFQNELEKILTTMRETPEKGAAMLRNRVTCIQHSSQWIDGMTRIINGNIADAPAEMIDLVREFMTREL